MQRGWRGLYFFVVVFARPRRIRRSAPTRHHSTCVDTSLDAGHVVTIASIDRAGADRSRREHTRDAPADDRLAAAARSIGHRHRRALRGARVQGPGQRLERDARAGRRATAQGADTWPWKGPTRPHTFASVASGARALTRGKST